MKALPISVYRTDRLGDCTNGGITRRYDTLLLICNDGFIDIDGGNIPENAVWLVDRILFGEIYRHLEPVKDVDRGSVGYMFGGNLAYSSDSRFPSRYPLCVHDRQETQEQYDLTFD